MGKQYNCHSARKGVCMGKQYNCHACVDDRHGRHQCELINAGVDDRHGRHQCELHAGDDDDRMNATSVN